MILKFSAGADLATQSNFLKDINGLDEYKLRLFLENYKENYPGHILSYTFISRPVFHDFQ